MNPYLEQDDAWHDQDLQEMLHRLYDAAGYEDYIYSGAPQPPLTADDEAWAQQLVRAAMSQ
jgi:hypothetical protein